ncbi:MAG: hypothetical protein DYG98_01555 [Haliscomenobacteraceae bacterium CHB4]|nr:hypothetical protein [Saprospiraceae bacterium]MCE7921717.1 hypothetical protein [Haliscomenobacteraceae bacterium CHB4]
MKNTLKTATSLLFVCAFAVIGCKKDERSPAEILTAGTCWKMTLLEGYDSVNKLWISVPIEDCEADNCFTFSADQSFTVKEGAAKCDPDDPQESEGAWSISDDGKKLSLTDSGTTDTGDIIELTEGKLVYELTFDEEKIRVTMRAN